MEEGKSLKQYAKEAKLRLKNGFWQNYQKNLNEELVKAEKAGVSTSLVRNFYINRVSENIKNDKDEKEEFYQKVKSILDKEGEISNAIGRLTDKEVFDSLDYEGKQRYTMELSEKYLQAIERYKSEKAVSFSN